MPDSSRRRGFCAVCLSGRWGGVSGQLPPLFRGILLNDVVPHTFDLCFFLCCVLARFQAPLAMAERPTSRRLLFLF